MLYIIIYIYANAHYRYPLVVFKNKTPLLRYFFAGWTPWNAHQIPLDPKTPIAYHPVPLYKFMNKSHSISLASVPTAISPRKSAGTHRGWQDALLLFWVRTNVTCFLSNRTIYLALALAKQFNTLCHSHCVLRFANPNALLAILPSACILKGKHLVYAKLLPGFSMSNFLLLRIDRVSFA